MYLVTASVVVYTLFYTPCQIGAFEWTDSLPNGTQLEVCERSSTTFPWGFHLAPGEMVDTVSYHQLQYGTPDNASESGQTDGMGTPIVSTDPHFTFTPDHQMIINKATVNDTGNYLIKVVVVTLEETEAQLHVTSASLLVKVSPVLEEGGPGLQAKLQPQAVKVTDGPQPGWHLELSCGTLVSLGQPAVTVMWTTPSGTVLPSTSYENGVFSLIVPNPLESGNYSCQLDPRAPVLGCVSNKSPLRHQPAVRLDAMEARVILLQAHNTDLVTRLQDLEVSVPPSSCKASRKRYPQSGVRTLTVGPNFVQVYCDQDTDGGGWTVMQRRRNGQVDFYRGWNEYARGFGDLNDEYWLGLENIHLMTSRANYTLRVDLWDRDGTRVYAQYDGFMLGGASDNYRLHVSGFSGTAGDSLLNDGGGGRDSNNMAFTTYDRDNDLWSDANCASNIHGAWWYNACSRSNLNGRYTDQGSGWGKRAKVWWYSYKHDYRSFARTEMMLRPRE